MQFSLIYVGSILKSKKKKKNSGRGGCSNRLGAHLDELQVGPAGQWTAPDSTWVAPGLKEYLNDSSSQE